MDGTHKADALVCLLIVLQFEWNSTRTFSERSCGCSPAVHLASWNAPSINIYNISRTLRPAFAYGLIMGRACAFLTARFVALCNYHLMFMVSICNRVLLQCLLRLLLLLQQLWLWRIGQAIHIHVHKTYIASRLSVVVVFCARTPDPGPAQ